jgi:hypothetical protein
MAHENPFLEEASQQGLMEKSWANFREGATIQAKVHMDFHHLDWPNTSYVMIRKVVVQDGKIHHKEALTLDGKWITIPEGAVYPSETHIPLASVVSEVHHQLF